VLDKKGFSEKWKADKQYPDQEAYILCRCGKSKNKPYCDSTHLKIKFDGTETADNKPYYKKAVKTEGPELMLADEVDLCASARFCDRDNGAWTLTEKSDDPKSYKQAIEECCNCPSGRLVIHDKKTGQPIEPKLTESISAIEDPESKVSGPLWVKGGVQIESADGKQYECRNRVTLCRCGQSKNKPFCDSTHVEVKFNDKS
jgi:CDGSH-type Zn-finger protein